MGPRRSKHSAQLRDSDSRPASRSGEARPKNHEPLAGELASFDEPPTLSHRLLRTFDPLGNLMFRGQSIATLKAGAAEVGESLTETQFSIGGREHLTKAQCSQWPVIRYVEEGRT